MVYKNWYISEDTPWGYSAASNSKEANGSKM